MPSFEGWAAIQIVYPEEIESSKARFKLNCEYDPAHMTKGVPHPFRAILDPHHLINETDNKNKLSDIIYLDPSPVCSKK